MMSRQARRHWWAIGTIAGAIGVLALFNLLISQTELDLSPLASDVQTRSPSSPKPAGTIVASTNMSLPETLARPLFSPTRRDFLAEPKPVASTETTLDQQPQPQTEAPPPQLVLQGTRTIAGTRSALVVIAGQESRWAMAGDEVAGWAIVSIDPDGLLIGRGKETIAIKLYPMAEN